MMFFVSTALAQKPSEHYAQLKKLPHINTDKNRLFVEQVLNQVQSKPYVIWQAPIYAYIAKLTTKQGNWTDGKRYLEQAISRLELVDNDNLMIDAFESISWVYFIRGNYVQAIFYLQKMSDYAHNSHHARGQIIALNRLALSYIELELFDLAIAPLQSALALARQTKDFDNEFLALLYLINARINLANIDPKDTLALILTAEKIPSKFNAGAGYLPRLKGIVNQQLDNYPLAEQWLKVAEDLANKNHDIRLLQMVSQSLSGLYMATDQALLARDYALTSLTYNNQMDHASARADIFYLLSKIYQQLGDDKNALKYSRGYAEYQHSASDKNIVSLLNAMAKRVETSKHQQKLTELENSLLNNKISRQIKEKQQQLYIFLIIVLVLVFCFFFGIFVNHHRMLKAQIDLSMKDELTGAFCRSYLRTYLPAAQSRFEREQDKELSIGALIIDCDDFKFINDTFGRAGGDKALIAIVDNISSHIREHDVLLRWGGDEFVLICESVSEIQMRELANRIIRSISDMHIVYEEATLTVTVSAGYALHEKTEDFNFDSLIKAADEFLLVAKKSGKNNCLGDDFTSISMGAWADIEIKKW